MKPMSKLEKKTETTNRSGTRPKSSKLRWIAGGTAVATVGKGCQNVCLDS
jgi:hypothetical protein